jgi:hypothetical protein
LGFDEYLIESPDKIIRKLSELEFSILEEDLSLNGVMI